MHLSILPSILPALRGNQQVLGMNARNDYVERENDPRAIRLVNDKHATKAALAKFDVPVVPTLAVVRDRRDLDRVDWNALPDSWALKPNNGCQGSGIMLAHTRAGDGWQTASGRPLDLATIKEHVSEILDGEYSFESMDRDSALFEPLIVPDPQLAGVVPSGLPDIRVVCYRSNPVLAMMRLPTAASGGRANLHQGAFGAGIDLTSGRVVRAQLQRRNISRHPDTGKPLIELTVPGWDEILRHSVACAEATGLGYMGADIVVDVARGPVVMEVNARPGLEIQNVTGVRLGERLDAVTASPASSSRSSVTWGGPSARSGGRASRLPAFS